MSPLQQQPQPPPRPPGDIAALIGAAVVLCFLYTTFGALLISFVRGSLVGIITSAAVSAALLHAMWLRMRVNEEQLFAALASDDIDDQLATSPLREPDNG